MGVANYDRVLILLMLEIVPYTALHWLHANNNKKQ